ncbi:hypothetical protein HNQ88_004026 [Aureibacter tunicatorum]|uniref:Uncharacterized protein n=1 Tax=Aureibacter tunicatorum TaxID=866807 RepID=A0AAE3XQT1_9BACT|nr:hypothetical protein [Aureibacter tunicatorum]BDD03730.1 hypothetical protein AUTU_12130 [Aureibacter tunicatorum]
MQAVATTLNRKYVSLISWRSGIKGHIYNHLVNHDPARGNDPLQAPRQDNSTIF